MNNKFLIRRQDCGHWGIWFVADIFGLTTTAEIAHLETFSDVLLFLNVGVLTVG